MPASLLCDFGDLTNPFSTIDSSNNLDLPVEFGWLTLNSNQPNDHNNNSNGLVSLLSNNNNTSNNQHHNPLLSSMANPQHQHPMLTALQNSNRNNNNSNSLLSDLHDNLKSVPLIGKRSQNTTECVPVPSSEHVAEIVGRQGCKIKALRAKTNTYIKTPVRGEEPVFVVTGRKEDVNAAKREILSAAEHFSQIRAQRKNNPSNTGQAPNANLPGHVTAQVRVPYRVVGLVVGPKGATIKRIQQQTNTYIITPSREKDPVFEVTGLPDDVAFARKEIEAHIALRTGSTLDSKTGSIGTPEESSSDSPLLSSFDSVFGNLANNNNNPQIPMNTNNTNTTNTSSFLGLFNSKAYKDLSSIFQMKNGVCVENGQEINKTVNGSYDTDEGLGDSPTFDILTNNNNFNSLWSPTATIVNGTGSPSSCESSSFNQQTVTAQHFISTTTSNQLISGSNNQNTITNPNVNNNNNLIGNNNINNNNNSNNRRSSSLDSTGSTISSALSTNNLSSNSSCV